MRKAIRLPPYGVTWESLKRSVDKCVQWMTAYEVNVKKIIILTVTAKPKLLNNENNETF